MKERIQQQFKESLTAASMRKFLGINSLYPQGQEYFNTMVLPSMLKGEKRWPSWDSEKLLAGFDKTVIGEENIQTTGPNLFIINHWSKGPMRAWWQGYMVSDCARRRGGQDVGWIVQDSLELSLGKYHFGVEVPVFSAMQRLFIDTYGLVEVPSDFKKKSSMAMRTVLGKFKNGDALGLLPELVASTDLLRGNVRSGQLVDHLAKIAPVGNLQPVYAKSCGNELLIKFGEAKKLDDFRDDNYQIVADRLMGEIEKLS